MSSHTNRRDHYIPQGYLRGFIDPRRLSEQQPLWHFDIPNAIWSERSPREVGYRFGFYDFAKSVLSVESVETSIRQLENTFPLVRQDLIVKKFQNWKNYQDFLLQYMQMMRARSLLFFEEQHATGKNLRAFTIEEIADDGRSIKLGFMTPELLSEESIKNRAIAEMLTEIKKGAAWLNEFNWALRYCETAACPFVIRETPIIFHGPQATTEQAFRDPESLLFFPLCWQACRIGSRQRFHVDTDMFANADLARIQRMYRGSGKLFLLSPQKLDDL